MPKLDPQVLAHVEWIGFLQPTGLVVSPHALVRAGAILDRRDIEGQRLLQGCTEEREFHAKEGQVPYLPDFSTFARSVLGWNFSPKGYAGTSESPIPPELEVTLSDFGETLRPDFAVREFEPRDGELPWQLLVRVLEPGVDFDGIVRGPGQLEASAHGRMERLLRRTGVPAGLLFNGRALRLLSAPRGESSGWVDFQVADMVQTAGRPISTALRLLLGQSRLLALPESERLAALLEDSRKFQNEVSERLAEQVLHALYELLRGFQAAHDASGGKLLRDPLAEHPDQVYHALLTVILRLVFLLYTEERDMLPEGDTFVQYYSLARLFERLREDAALYPDTMNQRFGAWAQLLVLFRLIYDGADSGAMHLPQRHGVLFDPDRFKFLEGRPATGARQVHEGIDVPLVPDGTIYRALEKLLVLNGERISYRALDVEQIGSVYETMMGFRLETANGRSVAIKATKKHGAPTTINLDDLLEETPSKRRKWIQDLTDRKITDRVQKVVKEAASLEDLHAALEPVLDKEATPDLVPQGAMILQPSEERRKSGSHYTPRELTEPIVRATLEPILARLRGDEDQPPNPERILDLKVCDPAMGSGAFLVEACRQLGDTLIEAWHFHDEVPEIPPDEDAVVFARRLIAQRCIYGVDRNPVAVDLSKMSLWLATLAKDHPLTFVDHALRHGDSLVGLSRRRIDSFHWDADEPIFQAGIETMQVRKHLNRVAELRNSIREADETLPDQELQGMWDLVQFELGTVRLFGDLVVAAFFEGEKAKDREAKRTEYGSAVLGGESDAFRGWLEERRHAQQPLAPFHWEIEFPEVFEVDNPGFDAMVGNPPFAGSISLDRSNLPEYTDFLRMIHEGSGGKCDLVAHFFRRAFGLLRDGGCLGFIGTKTIAQGDTRASSLKQIVKEGGEIFRARKRLRWPGSAAVVVSMVWIQKGQCKTEKVLNGQPVDRITSFLFDRGTDEDPLNLVANSGIAFVGCKPYGIGFSFDDTDPKATPTSDLKRLEARDSRMRDLVWPYLGGSEVNDSPTHSHYRYAINFGDMSLVEARAWPELLEIVETKVKPERLALKDTAGNRGLRDRWWQYGRPARQLYATISYLDRVLVCSQVSKYLAPVFLGRKYIFDQRLVVFAIGENSGFSVIQSRLHEYWAAAFGVTLGDTPVYTPSRCFETFPFPRNWENHPTLDAAGKTCYEFRAALMVRNDEGLTKTYNRFHDPDERDPEILKLRELHRAMDRAVLDAYGWTNISTDCEFLLDYEIDEENWSPRKKKPWRYRWPDEVRDEVLARLLELNAERAKEEALSGAVGKKKLAKKTSTRRSPKKPESGDLFS